MLIPLARVHSYRVLTHKVTVESFENLEQMLDSMTGKLIDNGQQPR